MSAQPETKRPRLPLVEPLESRFGSTSKDPKLINAYAEKDELGLYKVVKRQGVSTSFTIPSMPAGPLTPLGQYVATAAIGTIIKLVTFFASSGTNSSYAYIEGTGAPIALGVPFVGEQPFTGAIQYNPGSSGLDGERIFGIVGGQFFTLDVALSVLTPVVSPAGSNAPTVGLVVLDATTYFMAVDGIIWGSNLNDPTTWNGLNNIPAQAVPGVGVALARNHSYIVALKTNSTELLYDANNPVGSPLLAYPNSAFQWGCIDGNTVQDVEDRLFWLAQSKQSSAFVATFAAGQHERISTPGVERLLDDVTGPYNSFSFKDSGHLFYGLTAIGSNITLVYDIGQNIWYLWTDAKGNYWPWMSIVAKPDSTILAQSTIGTNANQIFAIDEEFVTDADGLGNKLVVPVDIYTANYDAGTRRKKTLMRMDFIADQQPALLSVRYTEDDFKSFSQFREVDLNTKRPTLTNCGTFRRRGYHFRYKAPYQFRIEAVELDLLHGGA